MWPLNLCILFFISGAYIFVALGLGSVFILIFHFNMPLQSIAQLVLIRMSSYPLLAMPLFMLAGNLLLQGGGVKKFIEFFDAWLGQIPGGLLIVTVGFCIFFAAMTGSGYATIAAVGAMMLPEMKKGGYSDALRSGVVACSGQLGNLIPPSITMVIIGVLMERSVATLFAAGLIPGVLIGLGSMVVGVFLAVRQGVERKKRASWRTRRSTFGKAFPMVIMPIVVLGGIYSGIFTPTEAAAMASVYAILIGLTVYGDLRSWEKVKTAFVTAMKSSVMIYMIFGGVAAFAYTISRSGLASMMVEGIIAMGLGRLGLVLILNTVMLAMGFFLNPLTLLYAALPILGPICGDLGISLIWLGVLWLINSLVGAMTPPMSPALYVAARVANMEPGTVFKGTIPFLSVWVAVMFLVIFVPDVALWLPRVLGLPGMLTMY